MAQMLREIGKPCENIVYVEETFTNYVITCEVEQDGVTKQVVYLVPKQS